MFQRIRTGKMETKSEPSNMKEKIIDFAKANNSVRELKVRCSINSFLLCELNILSYPKLKKRLTSCLNILSYFLNLNLVRGPRGWTWFCLIKSFYLLINVVQGSLTKNQDDAGSASLGNPSYGPKSNMAAISGGKM